MANEIWQQEERKFIRAINGVKIPNATLNDVDFIKNILPYTRNGICIDTGIMKIFLDGFIDLRFSKKINEDYNDLLSLFEFLQVSNRWENFWITPHLLTEI